MDPFAVFTYRYDRLCELLKGGDSRQLLDVAAILREFLLDVPNIVDEVNKNFRIKLRFRVHESSREQHDRALEPGTLVLMVHSGTTRPPNAPLTPVSRDQFLKHEVMSFNGRHYNVGQIVTACANKFGGKHYQDPSKDDPETDAIRYLSNHLNVAGASGAFSSLRLIGEITAEALRELYEASSDPKRIVQALVGTWPPNNDK